MYSKNFYKLIEEYKKFHEDGIQSLHSKDTFAGYSLIKWIKIIQQIMVKNKVSSIIDYGCGKANLYNPSVQKSVIYKNKKIFFKDIREFWNIYDVTLYDPAVKKYEKYPKEKKDLVICVDVLEHIPPKDTINFLDNIFLLANKVVFLVVELTPSKKQLSSGHSVHTNLKSKEDWSLIIKDMNKKYPKINTYLFFGETHQ
jgi:hypothetical protein